MSVLCVRDLKLDYPFIGGGKRYESGRRTVVDIPRLDVPSGAVLAITGPSGSGKTSLLYMLAGIEIPVSGLLTWNGVEPARLSESGRDRWRYDHVGMVFQDFHLLPGLSVLGSVLLPLGFRHLPVVDRVEARARAGALLARVGINDPDKNIETLSRGEAQRVALARALLRRPAIILADEPTASLDRRNGEMVFDLLLELAREQCATLVVATHDSSFAQRSDMHLDLSHGSIAQLREHFNLLPAGGSA